jgi:AcrR family transcriptional regulator
VGSISREDIVAAATGIVTAGGHEEMSVRSLAGSLGVAPMSLYWHIRDKDDPTGQFTQGPRHLLQEISSHARTTWQGGT